MMNRLITPVVEGVVEGLVSRAPPPGPRGPASPPGPPPVPGAPMVAPASGQQDALVFLGMVLSVAIPAGMVFRAAEDYAEGAPLEYALVPAWLIAAYAFSAAAFGVLFADLDASSLSATHWGLASLSTLCALRHSQRVCESPRRPSSALILSLGVTFGVVFAFRTSMRLDRCEQTLIILSVFSAAPAYRVYSKHRTDGCVDVRIKQARRRQHALMFVLMVLITAQPWLGVCSAVESWAETAQMVSDLIILALATDFFW